MDIRPAIGSSPPEVIPRTAGVYLVLVLIPTAD
jgi:hypothetical protein